MMGKERGPGGSICFPFFFPSALTMTKTTTKIMRVVVTAPELMLKLSIILVNKAPAMVVLVVSGRNQPERYNHRGNLENLVVS